MSEFDLTNNFNDPESDYSVEIIHGSKLSIMFGLHAKLRGYLYHYNIVKLRYKLLATTWLLATFVGYGTIISGEEVQLPFVSTMWIFVVSLLASAGIVLLWFLDVQIYHRILGIVFLGGLDIENENPILTKPLHNTMELTLLGKTGPVLFDGLFYVVQVFIILVVGWISLFYSLVEISMFFAIFYSIVFGLISFTLEWFMISQSKEPSALASIHQIINRKRR